jgi:LCP family protein required for cell wall assembly
VPDHTPVEDDLTIVLDAAVADGADPAPRVRRRTRRILIGLVLVMLALVGVVAATIYAITEQIGDHVSRLPGVFVPLDAAARPAAGPALTFLVVGTDTRSTDPTTGTGAPAGVDPGSQRSDVVMLLQLNPERTGASVISIPRDSWVDIPGHGKNKINAAYAYGGAPLLIQSVEKLTGVHVDHFGVIDFAGFQGVVDAVGGIDVKVREATQNFGVSFAKGDNHLDGASALAYVRQRYDLPGGDIDRGKRQQNAMRALLAKAVSGGILADPVQLYRFLDTVSRTVSIDDTMTNGDFRALALESRGLRPSGVTFLTAPVAGLGHEGAASVVYLDDVRAADLWSALRGGDIARYAATHPADQLGELPA